MQERILLFVTMYNCEKQIIRVLQQLNDEVCSYLSEVIIVNNRSTDNGEGAVMDFLENNRLPVKVSLLRNDENYGLGGSHKVAFNYAIENGFDYIIVLHGDDQGDIRDIIPYLKSGEAFNYDSFLGSRFERQSKLINYSAFRIFGNHVFNMIMSVILGKKITDLGSGLNMYKVKYLSSRFYNYFINSLTFNVYMLMYGVYSGSAFRFFPLSWREDDQVSNAKFIKQSKEILKLAIRYKLHPQKTFAAAENEYSAIHYGYKIVCKKEEE